MNNYPVWWDTTITLYNRYEDPQTQLITWYKHTIDSCFYKDISASIAVGDTNLETKSIICRIPKNDTFVERYLWIDTTNKSSYITLGVGDIIVRGNVSDTINEYSSGQRSSDLISKYKALQGCMQIEEVAINVGDGRCNEHYHVRGV